MEPFYIGIGTRNEKGMYYKEMYSRAFMHAPSKRSTLWTNIYNKCNGQILVEILFESYSVEEIKEKEKEFIQLYQRRDCCGGTLVNHTNGGDGAEGVVVSDKTKALMSKAHSGEKNGFYRKHHSEETIKLLKDINSIRNSGKGNAFYGKTHNEETRRIISLKTRARWDRGDLHLPPVNKADNNYFAKIVLVIPPDRKQAFIINGQMKQFCKKNSLSWSSYKKFIDKGPCEYRLDYNLKLLSKNTIGWEFITMGWSRDFKGKPETELLAIAKQELKDMDVTIVHYKKS